MDFEKLLHYRNSKNIFANLLGIKLTKIDLGSAEAAVQISENHLNPINSIHGGCLFTIADVAAAAAASSHGLAVTTLNTDFHFLCAGLNCTQITATAHEIKYGKRVMVYSSSVYNQDGTLLAEGIFTFMELGKDVFSNAL